MRITSARSRTCCRTSTDRSTARALTLALVEPKLAGARATQAAARLVRVRPRERVQVGASRRVPARHAQHARTASRSRSPRRAAWSSTRATSRSTRRRSTASTSTFTGSRSWVRPACCALLADSTNIDRKGFTGSERRRHRWLRRDLHERDRARSSSRCSRRASTGCRSCVDLAAQFDRQGRASSGAGSSRTRRSRSGSGYLRIPPGVADPRQRRAQLPRPGRGVHLHRLAGRAAGGAAADCDRRPPARQARAGGRRRVLGARDSRQREGDRPGDEPHRPAGRRGDFRRDQARPRLRARQPRKSSSSCFRWSGRSYFVPIHGEYRQLARHARVAARVSRRTRVAAGGERRRHPRSTTRGRGLPKRSPAGRILIDGTRSGEVGRRSAAGSPAPRRTTGWSCRSSRSAAVGALEETPDVITRGFVAGCAHRSAARRKSRRSLAAALEGASVEERTDPGLIKEKIRVDLQRFFRKAFRPPAAGAAGGDGDLTWPQSPLSRRVSEFVGVALFAAALIWLISLASYSASDPVWFFNTGVGPGAGELRRARSARSSAELSYQVLGYAAYLIPLVLVVIGWHYFWCRSSTPPTRSSSARGCSSAACRAFSVARVRHARRRAARTFRAGRLHRRLAVGAAWRRT